MVETEIIAASGYDAKLLGSMTDAKILKSEDISHSVMFLLSTPYNVNVTELTIKPVGEKM